jgi:hypothetical protein
MERIGRRTPPAGSDSFVVPLLQPEQRNTWTLRAMTSLEQHKASRQRVTAQQMRDECAMVDGPTTELPRDEAADQDFR